MAASDWMDDMRIWVQKFKQMHTRQEEWRAWRTSVVFSAQGWCESGRNRAAFP